MADKKLYKVVFYNQDQIYEVFVKSVYQAEIYGFVVLEDFVFGEKSAIVVDPGEEKLKREFNGVDKSYVPIHKIIRIDEVKQQGTAKMLALSKNSSDNSSNVTNLFIPDKP
ncbi:DUF1820 family protein [Methylocucumis oryzae]|uniref:DUF1820 domain-containing protein n=1 Tax=Methylocucumis oryzae TaxID=1632867 RepID=A0A0F3IGE2_9GAMM|nr:DUF1820 family protein [Methylocucumis oryzae]KJV05593.1 hypothetical protein VZ94_17025 [Methylocucumis oryzae]